MSDSSSSPSAPCHTHVSLLEHLHPDLLSLVYTFVPQEQLLYCASHLNHHLSSLLSPACFRGPLLLQDRLLQHLPSLPSRAFQLLCATQALSVCYGADLGWKTELNFFSATSTRSLLHFSAITRLSLRYQDSWDWLNAVTPIDLFTALLHSAPAEADVFPHLLHLELFGVAEYDEIDCDWQTLSRLHSLTCLSLCAFNVSSLTEAARLLSPPALQLLDVSQCDCTLGEEEKAEWRRRAFERGVVLQGCATPAPP